ncbi:MAG: hypothetical protein K0R31_1811 [Clostridiales bacterium]|jgi:hypothetical protein|nr:hypothetical protein [Clostridiales bacterium]
MEEIIAQQASEGEFQDLTFHIDDCRLNGRNQYELKVSGAFKNNMLGFNLLLAQELLSGSGEQDNGSLFTFYGQAVEINSIGKSSDWFIDALHELYVIPDDGLWRSALDKVVRMWREKVIRKKNAMKEQLRFSAVSLGGRENDVNRFKLFYDEENKKGMYFEFFIHINLESKILELNEKDTDYRRAMLKAFSK